MHQTRDEFRCGWAAVKQRSRTSNIQTGRDAERRTLLWRHCPEETCLIRLLLIKVTLGFYCTKIHINIKKEHVQTRDGRPHWAAIKSLKVFKWQRPKRDKALYFHLIHLFHINSTQMSEMKCSGIIYEVQTLSGKLKSSRLELDNGDIQAAACSLSDPDIWKWQAEALHWRWERAEALTVPAHGE